MPEAPAILELEAVRKDYRQGPACITALAPFSLTIAAGEAVALVGASGAGKSTALHIAGLLMSPDSGAVKLCGQLVSAQRAREATRLRRTQLGFVYQFHHLLPEFSAEENVAVPLWLQGYSAGRARREARAFLAQMGLEQRSTHKPAHLSGGEQQRVAIARALVHQPRLLLADEPTGNLDPKTAEAVETLMLEAVRYRGAAALMATHNEAFAARLDRVVTLA